MSYREAVRMHMPDLCARMDAHMVEQGETWVRPQVAQYEPDDLLTARQAADHCHIKPGTLQQWKARGLAVVETVDGRRYRVGDLDEYRTSRRLARSSNGVRDGL